MVYRDKLFELPRNTISSGGTLGGGGSEEMKGRAESEQVEIQLCAGFDVLLAELKRNPEDLEARIEHLKTLPDCDGILGKFSPYFTLEHWEMAATLEAYDKRTFDHSLRVAAFVYDMTKENSTTGEYLKQRIGAEKSSFQDLYAAALFHDIGKTAIPCEVLHDDHSRREWGKRANEWALKNGQKNYFDPTKLASLDEVELDHYFLQVHDMNGSDPLNIVPIEKFFDSTILKKLEEHGISPRDTFRTVLRYHEKATEAILLQKKMYNAADIASHHHDYEGKPIHSERYPSEISALRLGFELSILRSMDVYDALTSNDRSYKSPYTPLIALEILVKEAEVEFTEPTLTKYVVRDLYNQLDASQKNPSNENETRAFQKIHSFIEN